MSKMSKEKYTEIINPLTMGTVPTVAENLCYEADNMANSTDAVITHDAVILIPHRKGHLGPDQKFHGNQEDLDL